MFQTPSAVPSSDLREVLGKLGIVARDARDEHAEQARVLGSRPHVRNELRELINVNSWRARRPQRLEAALGLLSELARLEKLTRDEGRHSGCALPRNWNSRTADGYAYAQRTSTNEASRGVVVASVAPFLAIDRDVRNLCDEINWHVEAVAFCRIDNRPVLEAIAWNGGPELGAVVDTDALADVISILSGKPKKGDGRERITFA